MIKGNHPQLFQNVGSQLHLLAEMLSLIHASRMVHGDLKPDNFLVFETARTEANTKLNFTCIMGSE